MNMQINREFITSGPIVNYETCEYETSMEWEWLKTNIGLVVNDNCVPSTKVKILNVDWNGRVLMEFLETGKTYVTGVAYAFTLANGR